MHSPGETVPFLDPYPGRSGILSWIFSTDHKRIGMLYLWCILTMFAVGVVLGVLMRLELIAPGRDIMDAQTYNAMFTLARRGHDLSSSSSPAIPAAFRQHSAPFADRGRGRVLSAPEHLFVVAVPDRGPAWP